MLKLTSWKHHASAYKEISVPLPSSARTGQSWRLVLTAKPTLPHVSLDEYLNIGQDPFSIISMPVEIAQRPSKAASKQEQVERMYKLSQDPDRFLTIREKTSFDLDKKVWDSGIGMSSWIMNLARHELSADASSLLVKTRDILLTSNKCNVIELGAGTGIVSITLAAVRTSLHQSLGGGTIFVTDLASAIPLLSHNISANAQHFSMLSTQPQAFPLDWDDIDLPPQVQREIGGFDVILMADVTYNPSSFRSLIRTISSLIIHSTTHSKPPPLILLAYKERDPDERSLWVMLKAELGVDLRQVGECVGAGGAPVEFWAGVAAELSV